ncbi:MAG: ParB/RepB/Spo0J family partition protein [Desulfovibrio sp.]|nr:ParB/RepB/Spo0J family partition protein [Desulfovibrio sp.]
MSQENTQTFDPGMVCEIPLEKVKVNPNQPRRNFEKIPLEALKLSIAREGLLQPIAVLCDSDGLFLIAAGERRFRAVQELGWKTIPARIVQGNIDDLAIMENMIREDLNPMERALAMQKYLQQHRLTRKKLSAILGIARNSISEILSLNRLPQEIQDIIIADKRYSLHNMRIIARIRNPEEQRSKFAKLRAKIENTEQEKALENSPVSFDAQVKKSRVQKITKEIKSLQNTFSRQELKQIRPQVRALYEEIKALLYKIEDSISVPD